MPSAEVLTARSWSRFEDAIRTLVGAAAEDPVADQNQVRIPAKGQDVQSQPLDEDHVQKEAMVTCFVDHLLERLVQVKKEASMAALGDHM